MKREKITFNKSQKIIFGIIFLFSFLLSNALINAQQLNIYNFDTTQFPTMKVMFSARTMAGNEYNNITVDNFDVWENGILMDPTLSIDCNEVEEYPPVAVHFMLDASASMGDDAGDGQSRLKWIEYGMNAFLDTLHLVAPSQVAALTFAGLIKNFSGWVDSDSMRKWITSALKVEFGSTDFGPPFVARTPLYQGALFNLATRDPNLRRVAIFISDGEPERKFTQTVIDSIITVAKREKIQVYALFITSSFNNEINDICMKTGGKSYQVWAKNDMVKFFREIVGTIQNRNQCKLVWTAPFGCDQASRQRDVKVVFHRIPDSVVTSYIAPLSSIANVSISTTQLKFGIDGSGTTTQPLTLNAENADMTITGFGLQPANGKYDVDWNGKTLPFVIAKGESHTIYINYIEKPSTQSEETILQLQGNPCNPPEVSLIAPCGGKIEPEIDFGNVAINTTSDKTINCIFENVTPINISGDVQLSGADMNEFEIVSGAGPFTLTPDSCLTVTVRFKPNTTPGNKTAKLVYNTDSDCGPAETDLKGNAIQSSFPLPSLDFGKKRVLSDNTLPYTITNTTATAVTITNIQLGNTADLNFTLNKVPSLPLTLASNDSVSLNITFIPQDEGAKSNTIDLTIENVSGTVSGQLTGFGTLPDINAPDVDFGSVIVGAANTKDLVITNPSTTEDLTVYTVTMPSNPNFKFATGTDTDSIAVSMNGGTANLPIEFTPQSAGLKTVTVTILCDAATGNPPYSHNVQVNIKGYGLGLDITPTENDYGLVSTCGSKDATFVINNSNGNEDIIINSITFTGAGASAYAVVPPQPSTVQIGQSADIVVRFAPPSQGTYPATMVVNTSSGTANIQLNGTGSITVIKPEISTPTDQFFPGKQYSIAYNVNIPNLDGGTVNDIETIIRYYDKSLGFINNNNVTLPNINGWTWNVDGTQSGIISISGSGPALQLPYNFDFAVTFNTFLADVSTSSITVTPNFTNEDCLSPIPDTLEIKINTCFTEGRLILTSNVEYYLQNVKPNPAGSEFSLDFAVAFDGMTKIEIYNSMGELVMTVQNGTLQKGKYELNIPTKNLSNGVYLIKMQSGPFAKVRKLIINK